jgi:hypothetical protein
MLGPSDRPKSERWFEILRIFARSLLEFNQLLKALARKVPLPCHDHRPHQPPIRGSRRGQSRTAVARSGKRAADPARASTEDGAPLVAQQARAERLLIRKPSRAQQPTGSLALFCATRLTWNTGC